MVDLMHLTVIIVGVGLGAWALVGLRKNLPRGRFIVFGASSGAALFGCAALAGEVGIVSPAIWFVVVTALMIAATTIALRAGHRATT
jgi:hypothetical protein